MTGLEYIKQANVSVEDIARCLCERCPPLKTSICDTYIVGCKTCWLSWLTTGNPPSVSQVHKLNRSHTFRNLSEGLFTEDYYRYYNVGLALESNCPPNDCQKYLNLFHRCRDLDNQVNRLKGHSRAVLASHLQDECWELGMMFYLNNDIREYRSQNWDMQL